MAKIDFDIKYRPQIESGEYKVETRDGRSARIICWDMKSEDGYSILALVNDDGISETTYSFKNTGRYMNSCIDESDLFIVTPEPELAESEDERIRKWIYDLVENLGYPADEDAEKELNEMQPLAIAYLEKQKEKNTLSTEETELNSIAFLEQLGYTCVPPGSEQKPAEWSEEDDAILKEIVSFFKDGTVKLQHDLDLYAGFIEKKFKVLRPQPHWKPSEEQMDILDKVYHYLWVDRNATADMQDGLGDFIDELKSL